MTSFTQRALSLLGVIAILTTGIAAQEQQPLPKRPTPPPPTWERAQQTAPQHRIDLVTMKKPGSRVHCTVDHFTETEISCSHRFGKPTVYQREEVKAIVSRAKTRPEWDSILLTPILDGGIAVAIAAMVAAGPLGIAGATFLGIFTLVCNVLSVDGMKRTVVEEFVMYVKPGEVYDNVRGAALEPGPGYVAAQRT